MTKQIMYPVAYSVAEQAVIPIAAAPLERGKRYSCLHCGQRMSAVVHVTRKVRHFRHTDPAGCKSSDALHSYAVKIIEQAHAKAQRGAGEYMLSRQCSVCSSNFASETNLAEGWTFQSETTVVPDTRSDVVFSKSSGEQIVIEVVNTHEMESKTREAYRRAETVVGAVRVEWATVARLFDGLLIGDMSMGFPDRCGGCVRTQKERQSRLDRRKRTVEIVLSRVVRHRPPVALFRPWYYGKPRELSGIPTPMFPRTQRRVFANAIILTECGFVQHNPAKPWLFRYTIHEGRNVMLYADLGGSDVIPIYEDTAAMLYVFGDSLYDDDESGHAGCCTSSPISQYIVERAGIRLQTEGVEVRTGFLAAEHVERQVVNPLKCVDAKVLASLIRFIPG